MEKYNYCDKEYVIKRVNFSDNTKNYDGLCKESCLFESIIAGYFRNRTITNINQEKINLILKTKSDFEIVLTMFDDLINRIEKCEKSVPILPKGGGLEFKITKKYLRYVLILKEFVKKEYKKIVEKDIFIDISKEIKTIKYDSDNMIELLNMMFSDSSIEL